MGLKFGHLAASASRALSLAASASRAASLARICGTAEGFCLTSDCHALPHPSSVSGKLSAALSEPRAVRRTITKTGPPLADDRNSHPSVGLGP